MDLTRRSCASCHVSIGASLRQECVGGTVIGSEADRTVRYNRHNQIKDGAARTKARQQRRLSDCDAFKVLNWTPQLTRCRDGTTRKVSGPAGVRSIDMQVVN